MTMMKKISTSLATLSLGTSGAAMAATDGGLAQTSQGTFMLSAQVQQQQDVVRVFGLEDVDFGIVANAISGPGGTFALPSRDVDFCISRSTPGNIKFNVASFPQGGTLRLERTSGNVSGFIDLSATAFVPNSTSGTNVIPGADIVAPSSVNCFAGASGVGGSNFRLVLNSVFASGSGGLVGNYSGQFSITASAE